MNDNIKNIARTEPKDGFDLIEYPCDFAFKAMCRFDAAEASRDHIRELVIAEVGELALLRIKTNQSRTGKFESVTVTVKLRNRAELEQIYTAISDSPRVLMTL